MRHLLVLAVVGLGLLAAAGSAVAVGFDACVGRQCVSFHPLPTLLGEVGTFRIPTPFGDVWIVPCI